MIQLLFFFCFKTVIGPLVLISFVDRDGLYCSSENLIESLQKSTVFCSIAGEISHVATGIYFNIVSQLKRVDACLR